MNINKPIPTITYPWESLDFPPDIQQMFDPRQNRPYFVDHINKTSMWEDPRKHIWLNQQQTVTKPQKSSPSSPQKQLNYAPPVPALDSSPKPHWQAQMEEKYGVMLNHIQEITNDQTSAILELTEEIGLRFPTAGKELIGSILEDYPALEQACSKLREMGYVDKGAMLSGALSAFFKSEDKSKNQSTSSYSKLHANEFSQKNSGIEIISDNNQNEGKVIKSILSSKESNSSSSSSVEGGMNLTVGSGNKSSQRNVPSPLSIASSNKSSEEKHHGHKKSSKEGVSSKSHGSEKKIKSTKDRKDQTSINNKVNHNESSSHKASTRESNNLKSSKDSTGSSNQEIHMDSINEEKMSRQKHSVGHQSNLDQEKSSHSNLVHEKKITAYGPNKDLAKGPNKNLLLNKTEKLEKLSIKEEIMPLNKNGINTIEKSSAFKTKVNQSKENLEKVHHSLAKGPNPSIAIGPMNVNHIGPVPSLCKGPQAEKVIKMKEVF